jgi:hypothetical protein
VRLPKPNSSMAVANTATDSYPSPVTPNDSDVESSAHSHGRKRRASEIEDSFTRNLHDRGKAPARPTKKPKMVVKSTKKRKRAPSRAAETIEAELVGTDFSVECPALPDSRRAKALADTYKQHDAPAVTGAGNLDIDFAVQPGSQWSKLGVYKNAKCKSI